MIANNVKNNKSLSEGVYAGFTPLFNDLTQENFPFASSSANEDVNTLRIRHIDNEQDYYLNTDDLINSSSSYQIPRVYFSKPDANKPVISETFEIERLKNLLRYPIFKKDEQIIIWKRFRRLLDKHTQKIWVYYFEIDKSIYIFFLDYNSRFDLIFKSVESEFPRLYSKYDLKVKELSNKPNKIF